MSCGVKKKHCREEKKKKKKTHLHQNRWQFKRTFKASNGRLVSVESFQILQHVHAGPIKTERIQSVRSHRHWADVKMRGCHEFPETDD